MIPETRKEEWREPKPAGHPSKTTVLPQVVRPQVALPPLRGAQFDEGPARGVEDAQDGDADAQDDDPVANHHSCREKPGISGSARESWQHRFLLFTASTPDPPL